MTTISVAWLKEKNACPDAVQEFSGQPETDAAELIRQMIDRGYHLDWANWLIVRVMTRPQYLAYAIYSAECVLDIFEEKCPDDKRPRKAIEAAKAVLANDTMENRERAAGAAGAAAGGAMQIKILRHGLDLIDTVEDPEPPLRNLPEDDRREER